MLESLDAIAHADADSLKELARIAGFDPADFYRGADMSRADLAR